MIQRHPLALLLLTSVVALAGEATLYRKPTLSQEAVAFAYGGDLWSVPRKGGEARRLTTHAGVETDPWFSPDGQWIAFTGSYDGNPDVFVIPAGGGEPRRLTHHPAADEAVGWTPDGTRILFRSNRHNFARGTRLFTVPKEGGPATPVELPMATAGSYSPDGQRMVYEPLPRPFTIWKHYRGGQASCLWIADLKTGATEKIPHTGANDFQAQWAGDRIYFLSDRQGPVELYTYDVKTKAVAPVPLGKGLDLKHASMGPGGLVFERFGSLHVFEFATGQAKPLAVTLTSDLPSTRPKAVPLTGPAIHSAAISPSGARAVVEARGEILTVPAEKGDVRNLSRSQGVADRDPAWSPDGKQIAWLSDASGEYQMHVQAADGEGAVKRFALGAAPSFYYGPTWSPDTKRIAYTDKRLNLWVLDLTSGNSTKVDTAPYEKPWRSWDLAWSSDGQWLAYARELKNHLHALFAWNSGTGKVLQLTDGLSDARFPAFDADGKLLSFTASTDSGARAGWLDMASFPFATSRHVYVMVLGKDQPSPLAPESDEEKAKEEPKDDAKKGGNPATTIDPEGLAQRVLALPMPARNYTSLQSAKAGSLYLLAAPAQAGEDDEEAGMSLHKFDFKTRKADQLGDGLQAYVLAAKGEKALVRKGGTWGIAPADKPGDAKLKLAAEVWVDPRAEWAQMFHEAFRLQRDFFYDPGHHGVDLKATEARYAPYLKAVANRDDLTYLLQEAMGVMSVGHLYIGGGDVNGGPRLGTGLLGADLTPEQGRFRFSRVFDGEAWNPELKAPLTQPGTTVKAGEFLLEIDGQEVKASADPYALLVGKVGRTVKLKVGPTADGQGARSVSVVTLASEMALRHRAWVEDNRRAVDKLSGGRLAYVYLPNTAGDGYVSFNRYFYAQVGREGVLLDERYNGGGTAANYFIDVLNRKPYNAWHTREGEPFTTPVSAIFGPKAMLINEYAGSGGDALPWYFRQAGLGPLVGKRTWGGLVGIYDYPNLMDGGSVTAPRVAFYTLDGKWEVENAGVAPDVEVELDPAAWRQGRDTQLEKAVAILLDELKRKPAAKPALPPFPRYTEAGRQR